MMKTEIPPDHPRAESLRTRERLIEHHNGGVVATAGLIAHGRGEAFDYLLGEKTSKPAEKAIEAAAAAMLTAKKAVISVNGNAAALVSKELVLLRNAAEAEIEVNLFYRSHDREEAIRNLLGKAGAKSVLGVEEKASATIPELGSERRRVDPKGILIADVVLVPLEDGDRTEALAKMGKKVIAVDLNPLSRTAQTATITIVDNIVRAIPELVKATHLLKPKTRECHEILQAFDNRMNLSDSITLITRRLERLAKDLAED